MKGDKNNVPGWVILLAGVLLGQSGLTGNVFSVFHAMINEILVPLYGLCVLCYIGKLISFRYVLKKSSPPIVAPPEPVAAEPREGGNGNGGGGPVNMTGSFRLVRNDNFEGFLEVQGVPWALRRAANQARPIHQITHVGKTVTIQIKGIIESQTTYEIDGPPVETNIRGRIFRDQMKYLESGDGIQVCKTAITEGYDITVSRRLTPDKKTVIMVSRATFRDGREPVQAVQFFDRIQ